MNRLFLVMQFLFADAQRWWYEKLPISKHFLIKLHWTLIEAKPLNHALQRQFFIPRV